MYKKIITFILCMLTMTSINQNIVHASTSQHESNAKKIIYSGLYKVGTDIPAGEYYLVPKDAGYYAITSDKYEDDIISNDFFTSPRYLTVKNGVYLRLDEGITMYPINEAPKRTFKDNIYTGYLKVGRDIKPGDYMIQTKVGDAYYSITDKYDNIYENDIFTGKAYVNLKNGQYIYLSDCYIKLADWENNWAYKEIESAMNKGWINKTDTFRPNDSITRAEFIKIINKAFGFTSKSSENFKDVNSSSWYYNEVCVAVKAGYIDKKQTNFRPNDLISREEAANIITTITKTKDNNLNKIKSYKDYKSVSSWALSSVEGAIESGYMGVGQTQFRPKENITRAEAITTIVRVN